MWCVWMRGTLRANHGKLSMNFYFCHTNSVNQTVLKFLWSISYIFNEQIACIWQRECISKKNTRRWEKMNSNQRMCLWYICDSSLVNVSHIFRFRLVATSVKYSPQQSDKHNCLFPHARPNRKCFNLCSPHTHTFENDKQYSSISYVG